MKILGYVYYLRAEGSDYMTDSHRVIHSTTCFTSIEKAHARIEKFRQLLVERDKMTDTPSIQITIVKLEVVE